MSELIDNRARRIEALKRTIRALHQGEPVDSVRARLAALLRECDASEVAQSEQELMADGLPVAQVIGLCDLHSQAVRGVLAEPRTAQVPPGHPVDAFRRENAALREQAARLRGALDALGAGPEAAAVDARTLAEARGHYALLLDVDKHYRRKEHLLFPFLEKRGITGPSTVMWAKDDEVRARLDELGAAFDAGWSTAGEWRLVVAGVADPALRGLEEMVYKEENILLPLALRTLGDGEWGEIAAQSPQIGYCLVDPAADWRPPAGAEAERAGSQARDASGALTFPTGSLTPPQLQAILAALPVDLTFVDADDRVRFFSEGPKRVFQRARAVIGRKVQLCHPPASVAVVERILADFRSGRQDVAEFWLQARGRFVHVRYFALRDAGGAYQGTLEVTQDLTRERGFEGERRLLQYEA